MAATLVFNAANYAANPIKQRNLLSAVIGSRAATLSDGTTIDTDRDGRIFQAHYSNGVKLKRNNGYCMVQSEDSGFWYCDKNGRWFPLD